MGGYVKTAGYLAFKISRSVYVGLTEVASIMEPHRIATPASGDSSRCFIMSSDATMLDSELDNKIVYLAYRDIFKNKLAKLRKRNKVHNVVEKHKDYLYY